MAKRMEFGRIVLSTLGQLYALEKEDLGSDAHLAKKGIAFDTEGWEIDGVGHLCIMKMRAFLGLMRMETVVIAPTSVDMPLFNVDWVRAFGKETQIVELYDTQLQSWPEENQAAFEHIRDWDADLPDASNGEEHWYDGIMYPCSYHKAGKGLTVRFSAAAQDYLATYVEQLASASPCDAQAKQAKVGSFANRLFDEGGPAVDQVTKLFGASTSRRLIVECMYGVRQP